MQRCQEFTVIPAAPAAARARRPERRNHDLPLGLGHLSQHGRLLRADPSESPMPSNVNPLFSIHRIPSTRPRLSLNSAGNAAVLQLCPTDKIDEPVLVLAGSDPISTPNYYHWMV